MGGPTAVGFPPKSGPPKVAYRLGASDGGQGPANRASARGKGDGPSSPLIYGLASNLAETSGSDRRAAASKPPEHARR